MKEWKLDCGVEEYAFAGGVLHCNPNDPNLYARFLETAPELAQAEKQLLAQVRKGGDIPELLRQTDSRMKELLEKIFPGNDFDRLLQGVNLLTVAQNGQRVITNLLESLEPILQEGGEAFACRETEKALKRAKARRGGLL